MSRATSALARRGTPSCKRIAAAWAVGRPWGDKVDDEYADQSCWACGFCHEFGMVRAHVLAVRNGGGVEPDNFFLLCGRCHREQPDAATRETQLRWLREHPTALERTMKDENLVNATRELATLANHLPPEEVEQMTAHILAGMWEAAKASSNGGERASMIAYLQQMHEEWRAWIK